MKKNIIEKKILFKRLFLICLIVPFLFCSRGPIKPIVALGVKPATINMKVAQGGAVKSIADIKITVKGNGNDDIVEEFSVDSSGGKLIEKEIEIPVGVDQVITIEAYDSNGEVLYRGAGYIDASMEESAVETNILLFKVAERQAGVMAYLADSHLGYCQFQGSFYALPASYPGKIGVNGAVLAEFFGSDAGVLKGQTQSGDIYLPFEKNEDNNYKLWLTYDGMISYANFKFPDHNFDYVLSSYKTTADSPSADISVDVGEDIVIKWNPVKDADLYYVGLSGKAIYESTVYNGSEKRKSVLEGEYGYEEKIISIEKITSNLSVSFSADEYLGDGTFSAFVIPINGPASGKVGATGNFIGGSVRGFAVAYSEGHEKSLSITTGMGYDKAATEYGLGSYKCRSVTVTDKYKMLKNSVAKYYSGKDSGISKEKKDPLCIAKVVAQRLDRNEIDVSGKIFSDPVVKASSVEYNNIEILGEEDGDEWLQKFGKTVRGIQDSACTLSVKMPDGSSALSAIVTPSDLGSLYVDGDNSVVAGSDKKLSIKWDSVKNAKGYIVRFELDVAGTFFLDTIVYDTVVNIKGEKYYKNFGNLTIKVIPFNGNNPNERFVEPNLVGSILPGQSAKVSAVSKLFSGYYWVENLYGSKETSVEILKNANFIGVIPSFDMNVPSGGTFDNDFENGRIGNWKSSGFWHVTKSNIPGDHSCGGRYSIWYGRDKTGDFDDGAINYGWLVSPPVTVGMGDMLKFCSWSEIETQAPNSYDFRLVLITLDKGKTWKELWHETEREHDWKDVFLSIPSEYVGKEVNIAFVFNTRDNLYNDFRGWYVDDIEFVSGSSPKKNMVVDNENILPIRLQHR